MEEDPRGAYQEGMGRLWLTPEEDLGKKNQEIVPYNKDQVGTLIGKICGEDVRMNLVDPEVGEPEPEFPSDEECGSDDELEDGMGGL